ncbi:hypothetical protein L1987_12858 [Smallanthus sonchifolius]|uniref:Uncharacterized protein n=1 Tax=Smallanthus sonchifolius TaxID=185202 RepID=A0ACB9JFV8_9ASTR|nr:hypothetical protein L1987_12858 [Smallanthus sonchifolius]
MDSAALLIFPPQYEPDDLARRCEPGDLRIFDSYLYFCFELKQEVPLRVSLAFTTRGRSRSSRVGFVAAVWVKIACGNDGFRLKLSSTISTKSW